jgi:hypothetical protein
MNTHCGVGVQLELAAKADRAHAQLIAGAGEDLRQHRLRGPFAERHLLLAEAGLARRRR